MPTVEDLFNDPAYQRPGQAKPSGGQTVEDLFNDPAYQRPTSTQETTPTTTTAPVADPGLVSWLNNNLWPPVKYVAGRTAAGVLKAARSMGESETAVTSLGSEQLQTSDPEKMLGVGPAPGPISRYAGTVGEAFGSNPFLAALAPEATIAGSLAGEGTMDLTGNKWAAIAASVLFGAGATGVRTALATAATNRALTAAEAAAKARYEGVNNELTRAQDELRGIKLDKKGDIREIADASKAVRDAAIEKANQELAAANATGDANLANQANQSGKSATLQDAGTVVQNKVRDWVANKFPAAKEAAVKPINDMVKDLPEMVVGRDNFASALKQITESGGSNQALIDALRPSLPARLLKVFEAGGGKEAEAAAEMLGIPKPKPSIAETAQSWEDASRLRTAIGDAMANPSITKDIPASNLKTLYAAQHADMREALLENAPSMKGDAVAAFDKSNADLTNLYKVAEDQMGNIVHGPRPVAGEPKPEDVAAKLLSDAKRGGTDLQVLRKEVPEAVDELAGLHLRNPADWKDLSPEAKSALVPDVDRQKAIDLALATKQGATEAHQTAVAAAKTAHKDEIKQATDAIGDTITGKTKNVNELNKQLRESKEALDEATKQLPMKPSATFSVQDIPHILLHHAKAPGLAGGLAYTALEGTSHPIRLGASIAAAAAAPYAVKAVVGAAKKPISLGAGLQAGMATNGNDLNTPAQ